MKLEEGVKETLFALVQSVICGEMSNSNCLSNITQNALREIYDLTKSHDIAHIVALSLNKYGLLAKDEISQKFKKQWMAAQFRFERINYELKRIAELFENNEIAFVFLKGSTLRQYYPEPWMRTSCDIDVLIHHKDIAKATSVLCNEGFIQQKTTTTYDYQFMSPCGVHFELHYSLKQDASILQAESILDNAWESCELEPETRFQYRMTNEMFLFYHMVHMANHFTYGGCGIRPLIDLWLLLNKMGINMDRLHALLETAKLRAFYQSAVELCEVWMENKPHTNLTVRMEEFILTGGVYGTLDHSATMKAASGESKFDSFMKMLFLPRANLEITYPNLRKHPKLLLYYQVKRLFRVFNHRKRRFVARATTARNLVTEREESQARLLLKDLGLK